MRVIDLTCNNMNAAALLAFVVFGVVRMLLSKKGPLIGLRILSKKSSGVSRELGGFLDVVARAV